MKNLQFTFVVPAKLAYGVACVLAGGLLFTAAGALADGSTATQSVLGTDLIMPYDGYLMIDAAPITGVRTIKFDLYQDATGGVVKWTETQTVNLYNGRFSVGLGSSTSLTSTILDAEKLYLSMTIIDTDSQGNAVEIELSGRQTIEPAPFAAWAGNSTDMKVSNTLTVVSNATVGGTLDATGAVTMGSTLGVTSLASLNGGAFVDGGMDVEDGLSVFGEDNDGTSAVLKVGRLDNPQFGYTLIDNNEIDVTVGEMVLNGNSNLDVRTGGKLVVGGDLDLADNADIYDVDIINGFNDIRFRANSGDTADDMKLTSSGHLEVYNNLEVDGNVTLGNSTSDTTTVKGSLTTGGDLTVNGNLKSWPEGNYCILQSTKGGCSANASCSTNGNNCPSGFTARSMGWDTDGNATAHPDLSALTSGVTVNGATGMLTYWCCK